MKRGLLGFPLLILLTQVVNAQFYSGYGGFSLTGFFDRIDPQTIILVLLFLIFFALIFYALSRIFKDPYGQPNKGIAGTIAFAVTSLIIYGLYRTGFDLGGVFYNLGFSSDLLYPILAVVFLIIAVLLIWKLKVSGFLMIFGLFILLITIFTDIFYEKGLTLIIGIVLLLVGLLLWRRSRRIIGGVGRGALRAGKWVGSKYDWEKEKKQAKAIGKGIGWTGKTAWKGAKGVGRGVARGMHAIEARKLRRAEEAAYKEDARREQAQGQIQQINNEISRLQQMIPSASVIERGKIEDQIKVLLKRTKKLRKEVK